MFHNNEGSNGTLLDFNRSGIPLIEIISEPDIENSEECVEFIKTITLILRHLNISNARMNKGEIRADVNISLAIKKNELYENGNRIEIKNLNSLENIQKAIKYEEKRQVELINDHKIIEEETRKFDENKNLTLLMRKKQSTNDYRYFRDSNIPAVYISDFEIENIKNKMKVLPSIKFQKYIKNYGLNSEDANTLIWAGPDITDFFDETIIQYKNYKIAASFILTEVLRWMKELNITKIPFPVKYFISLLEMMEKGEINRNDAKKSLK